MYGTAADGHITCVSACPDVQMQGVLINLINALFGAGSLCAPLLAELCSVTLGSSLISYWLTAAMTAASAVTFLLLPSPKPPAPSSSSNGASGGKADRTWSGPLLWVLVPMALFVWASVGTEVAVGGWMFTYAVQHIGTSPHVGEMLNAGYWGAFTGGRVIASMAAAALKPVTVLCASMPLAVVGALIAVMVPAATLNGWLSYVVTILIGLGVSTGFANALSLLDSWVPVTGGVTGFLGGVAGGGCMIFPLIVALLAKHTSLGYQGLMWSTLLSFALQALCLVAAVMAWKHVAGLHPGQLQPHTEPLLQEQHGSMQPEPQATDEEQVDEELRG